MSKKKYRTRKPKLPSVFGASQVLSQAGESVILEQSRASSKPKETGMAVNDNGDLVWKRKKIKKKHHFSINISWSMLIWLIFSLGFLALHIWIWDFVDDEGHSALWMINVVFFIFFFTSALKDDYIDDTGFKKLIDVDCYSYSVEKEKEEPFKVKMPKELGSEPISDSLQIMEDKVEQEET